MQTAPNYALVEVAEAEVDAFASSISNLDKNFDSVVVLWRATSELPRLSKKFKIFAHTDTIECRWDLLDHCSDGFVFPLEVGTYKSKNQQVQLKSMLFKFGGHCFSTFASLSTYFVAGSELSDTFKGPVLVSSLNPNQMVFDERFLNLRSQKIRTATEIEDLTGYARNKGTPILACEPDFDVSERGQKTRIIESRADRDELIEILVRNPRLARIVNIRIARLWSSVWAGLNYPNAAHVHPDQIKALATHRSHSRPTRDELSRAANTLKILAGGATNA